MVSNQQIISTTRSQLEEQQRQLQQQKQELGVVSKKRIPFVSRGKREAGRQITKQEKRLEKKREAFEREIARASPKYAKEKYLEQAYGEAKTGIETKLNKINRDIEGFKNQIKKLRKQEYQTGRDEGKLIRKYEKEIQLAQKKKKGFLSGLGGGREKVVEKFFSGFTSGYASSLAAQKAVSQLQKEQLKKLAPQIKRFEQWKKRYGNFVGIDPLITGAYLKGVKDIYGSKAVSQAKKDIAERALQIKEAAEKLRKDIVEKAKQARTKLIGTTENQFGFDVGMSIRDEPSFVERTEEKIGEFFEPIKKKAVEVYETPFLGLSAKERLSFFGDVAKKAFRQEYEKAVSDIERVKSFLPSPEIPITTEGIKIPVIIEPDGSYTRVDYKTRKKLKGTGKVKFIRYSEFNPGVTHLNLKEFLKTTIGFDVAGAQERRIKGIQNELNESYGEKIADRVQYLYSEDLVGGMKTWDQAMKEYEKTNEYKEIINDYKNTFNKRLKLSITPGAILTETTEQAFELAPETWLGFGGYAYAGIGLSKLASPGVATSFLASKPITTMGNLLYQSAPTPKTRTGGFIKAATSSALITGFAPGVGVAYSAELGKGLATDPFETATALKQFATTSPEELLGFAVGGPIFTRGARVIEAGVSRVRGRLAPVTKVTIPKYGEVYIQKVPKYGDVVWVKGSLAATEKITVMRQIQKLTGRKPRIFVSVSQKGVPTKVFSNTRGAGFEVRQIDNPMRGLYEAPPWEFLKKHIGVTKTEAGAASYYASLSRERLLPDPLGFIDILTGKAKITRQRPFEYLRRTAKGIDTPSWIQKVAKAMKANKSIPKAQSKLVNKYYNDFMRRPIEFNGKTYVGTAKANLLNKINLRLKGSGTKLKVYSALMEYQIQKRVQLIGGAENLSGILPFGPESQVVSAIGTRFFLRSIKDLRKGVKPTPLGNVVEFLTGTKRGEARALIEGKFVELQPVRAFPGKVSKAKVRKIDTSFGGDFSITDSLISTGAKVIKRTIRESKKRPVSPPRPIPLFVYSLLLGDTRPRTTRRDVTFTNFLIRESRGPRKEKARPRKVDRREEFRLLPRVDRPRKVDRRGPRRLPREPRDPREPRAPRVPERPPTPENFLMQFRKKKKKVKKKEKTKIKRKPIGRVIKPTAFQLIEGVPLVSKSTKKTKDFTGFEIFR